MFSLIHTCEADAEVSEVNMRSLIFWSEASNEAEHEANRSQLRKWIKSVLVKIEEDKKWMRKKSYLQRGILSFNVVKRGQKGKKAKRER